MRKNLKSLPIPVILSITMILCYGAPAFAGLGKIAGTVTDASTGEALPGVNVLIVGTTMGAATDIEGRYFILNVPPGSYSVRVSFMGYTTKEFQDVRSQLDVTTTLDVELQQEAIMGETVTVVAERPIVDKTMTATKVTFDAEVLDNALPLTNLEQILNTSVTSSDMRGGIRRDVAYLLDGVDITDKYLAGTPQIGAGYSRLKLKDKDDYGNDVDNNVVEVNMSGLQEASVVAGTFNAEYFASGGVVNLATRNGSQNFSGKLFFRSSIQDLKNAGPSVYNHSDWYFNDKRSYEAQGDPTSLEIAKRYTWSEDAYPEGGPAYDGELSLGGPLTSKGNFFLTGRFFQTNGLFPTEWRRQITTNVKLNYSLTSSDKLTGYVSVDDGGKLLGWKNRTYSFMYTYYPAGNPLNQKLGLLSYLKWIHTFDPGTFLELKVASLNNRIESGFVDPDGDGIITYDDTDGDFIILDTVEKSQKYLPTDGTGWFHPDPGNDQSNQSQSFGNQVRISKPAFAYSKLSTDNYNISGDLVKQVNFNHQLKLGFTYNYRTVDLFTQATSISRAKVDPNFPFDQGMFTVHPWDFGTYVQDRVEYKGIIVNAGIRLDGYNVKGKEIGDLFLDTWEQDTLSTGAIVAKWKRTEETPSHTYVSPRLGISHPITENSSMHYSWGLYTTPPNIANIFTMTYDVNPVYALAGTADPDPEPVKSTAYEIGVQTAFLQDYGLDLTAYYRDVRNSGSASYTLAIPKSVPVLSQLGYSTSGGFSDSRGIEVNLWKRPSGFFSGRLSLAYAYTKSSVGAGAISLDPAHNQLTSKDQDIDWGDRFLWPMYAFGQNEMKAKLTLLFNLPFDIQISSYTNYNSPWRYQPSGDITDRRYRVLADGESFLQSDLRITKYISFSNMRAAVFFEGRNILDRENILRFDNYLPDDALLYEQTGYPYGTLERPADTSGNPFAGIPRQLYGGIEFYF